jgi:hypothetical protein
MNAAAGTAPRPVVKTLAVFSLGLLLAVLLLISARPDRAAASGFCAQNPPDPSVGCVRTNDTRIIDICDRQADGHYVYAHVYTQGGSGLWITGYDWNGSAPGCDAYNAGGNGIFKFALCIQTEGCGPVNYIARRK